MTMHNFTCVACSDRTLVITAEVVEQAIDWRRDYPQFVVSCGNGHEMIPTLGMEIRVDPPEESDLDEWIRLAR